MDYEETKAIAGRREIDFEDEMGVHPHRIDDRRGHHRGFGRDRDSQIRRHGAQGQLGAVRSAISIYYADNEGVFPTVPLGFDRTELITTLTANTKYLQRWVPLSVPKHHGPVWTIDQVAHDDFFAIDAICDGEFVYVAPRTAAAWGKLAIECYHTDLKGSTWSTF